MRMARFSLLLPLLLFTSLLWAAIDVLEFDSPEQEALFQQLTQELRCLVCQNQNLADSDADLARDLRMEVYEMVKSGQNAEEIKAFLVARYGDFVLYRPPLQRNTLLLWGLPPLLLLVGLLALWRFLAQSRKSTAQAVTETQTPPSTRTDPLDLLQDEEP